MWDVQNFELKGALQGHSGYQYNIIIYNICSVVEAICGNGKYLFSGSADKDIRVWDITTQKCVKILDDHSAAVKALVADEDMLYSAANDKTIRVWALADMSCVRIFERYIV
jgi:WD40 repeat protein